MLCFALQSYERRSRAIKATSEKEKKYWSDVTPDMMSDEEKDGNTYIRHPPSYRSERLSRFIERLDSRLDRTPSRHARHARVLGSPIEKQAPARAKSWMLKDTNLDDAAVAIDNDDQNLEAPASDGESFRISEEEETQ